MEARQEFYEVLKKRLLDQGIVQHVGLWNQDTDYLESDEAMGTPAVLVEMGPAEWEIFVSDAMRADSEVSLHILTAWDAEGDDKTAWQLSQRIMQVMAQMKEQSVGDNFAVLRPMRTLTNSNHGNILESIDTYTVRFYSEFRS